MTARRQEVGQQDAPVPTGGWEPRRKRMTAEELYLALLATLLVLALAAIGLWLAVTG